MSIIYVLIFIVVGSYGKAAQTHEFYGRQACEDARAGVEALDSQVKGFCTPKGVGK